MSQSEQSVDGKLSAQTTPLSELRSFGLHFTEAEVSGKKGQDTAVATEEDDREEWGGASLKNFLESLRKSLHQAEVYLDTPSRSLTRDKTQSEREYVNCTSNLPHRGQGRCQSMFSVPGGFDANAGMNAGVEGEQSDYSTPNVKDACPSIDVPAGDTQETQLSSAVLSRQGVNSDQLPMSTSMAKIAMDVSDSGSNQEGPSTWQGTNFLMSLTNIGAGNESLESSSPLGNQMSSRGNPETNFEYGRTSMTVEDSGRTTSTITTAGSQSDLTEERRLCRNTYRNATEAMCTQSSFVNHYYPYQYHTESGTIVNVPGGLLSTPTAQVSAYANGRISSVPIECVL